MITYSTAALLFPAISLIMLAYTNRFLALAALVRSLHAKYLEHRQGGVIKGQIGNLRFRLNLIRHMQGMGVLSFIACIICTYGIYLESIILTEISFAMSLLFFTISLILSFVEIQLSNKALELELSDMEENEESFVRYFKKKLNHRKGKHRARDQDIDTDRPQHRSDM